MLPVQRISKTRKRKRRSHHALRAPAYINCHSCGTAKLPHAACTNCGFVNHRIALKAADVVTEDE